MNYLYANCFGVERSIVWIQTKRDAVLERWRAATGSRQRDDAHEMQIGRLRHDRVTIPRDDGKLFEWAQQVMFKHAKLKSVLEIEFKDEEGTGLGPTLEFYALIAAELQRKDLGMWLVDDDAFAKEKPVQGDKPIGFYVQRSCGLFPAPLPPKCSILKEVEKSYLFLGIALGKCLLDSRLMDMPLSPAFFKVLCGEELDDDDFLHIYPHRAKFILQLKKLNDEKERILNDKELTEEQKKQSLSDLRVGEPAVNLEDLGLTFCFNPSSTCYKYNHYELIENGSHVAVCLENVGEYVEIVKDYCLKYGIQKQVEAVRRGFEYVLPICKLNCFSISELQLMICGEQSPNWTREDVLEYCEPKNGFDKQSATFQYLATVLVELEPEDRKWFLQFVTGCSSLPPGGLANLNPRLTVVKKDGNDHSYPSVNTCMHYLKLPEYSSQEVLKTQLLAATKHRGFHLN